MNECKSHNTCRTPNLSVYLLTSI